MCHTAGRYRDDWHEQGVCGRRGCAGVFVADPGDAGWAALPARRTASRRNPASRVFHYVAALRVIANAAAHHEAMQHGLREPDPAPVVKFFNPCGAATWLFSELDADGDTLFGLCDLGFGCPELGSASLTEIAAVTLPLGLTIERDLCFEGRFPLTVYADAARLVGRITEKTARLEAAAEAAATRAEPDSDLPPP